MPARSKKPRVAEVNRVLEELSEMRARPGDPIELSRIAARASYLHTLAVSGAGAGFAKCMQGSPPSEMVLEGHADGLYWVCSHDPQHKYRG